MICSIEYIHTEYIFANLVLWRNEITQASPYIVYGISVRVIWSSCMTGKYKQGTVVHILAKFAFVVQSKYMKSSNSRCIILIILYLMLQMYLSQLPYGIYMILNCILCNIIVVFAFILVMLRTLVVVDYDRHTISYNGFNAFKSDCIIWNGYWSELSIYSLHIYFERKLNSMFVSKSLDIHVSIHMLVAVVRCSLVLIQLYLAHIQYVIAAKYIFICMYTDIKVKFICFFFLKIE